MSPLVLTHSLEDEPDIVNIGAHIPDSQPCHDDPVLSPRPWKWANKNLSEIQKYWENTNLMSLVLESSACIRSASGNTLNIKHHACETETRHWRYLSKYRQAYLMLLNISLASIEFILDERQALM